MLFVVGDVPYFRYPSNLCHTPHVRLTSDTLGARLPPSPVSQPRSLLIDHPEVPTGIAVPTGNTALKSKSVRVVNPPGWLGHVPAGGGGGGTVTVITAVPVTPSLVAVIVAEPIATPITSPLPFTVATSVLLLTQVTTRPSSGLLFASRGVAVSCT